MKYFRTYPWGLQLLIFLLMIFTLLSSASVIILSLLPKLSGYMPSQLSNINPQSPSSLINATLMVQGFSNFAVFFLPPFLFAYLAHPQPRQYLGLQAPGKKIHYLLAVLIVLGAQPVLEFIGILMSHIDFGPKVRAAQKANDDIFNALLNITSFSGCVKTFFVMAIIPGFGEELFFRGILMRFAKKQSRNMVMPVIFTAAIFAFSHSNIDGFLSIFLAGVLLAVIYNLTGSLWCSILAHVVFNGSQIVLAWLAPGNAAIKNYISADGISYPMVVIGAVVFSVSFYLLLKNKTPLPKDWTNDFKNLAPALSEGEGEVE